MKLILSCSDSTKMTIKASRPWWFLYFLDGTCNTGVSVSRNQTPMADSSFAAEMRQSQMSRRDSLQCIIIDSSNHASNWTRLPLKIYPWWKPPGPIGHPVGPESRLPALSFPWFCCLLRHSLRKASEWKGKHQMKTKLSIPADHIEVECLWFIIHLAH